MWNSLLLTRRPVISQWLSTFSPDSPFHSSMHGLIEDETDEDSISFAEVFGTSDPSDMTMTLDNYEYEANSDYFLIDYMMHTPSPVPSLDGFSDWAPSTTNVSEESSFTNSYSNDSSDDESTFQLYKRRRFSIYERMLFPESYFVTLETDDEMNESNTELSEDYKSTAELGPSCSICLDTWNEILRKKHFVYLNCGHAFCNGCVDQMRQRSQCCPTCRTKITTVKRLYF